jgi:hypothetical protein
MGRISTFQAPTVTTTSISFFFSCFLEAVALFDIGERAEGRVAQK